MPTLFIIAGPNGAGKTTSANQILPGVIDCIEFVNADYIAKGLSPFNAEGVSFEAGRIMLKRIKELADQSVDFVIETTLSTSSYVKFIRECKQKGYYVILIYVWLDNVNLAKRRVGFRVSKGGHNIPSDVIERRYNRGLQNLREKFLNLSDEWMMVDNSGEELMKVAFNNADGLKIIDNKKYNLIIGNE